MLIVKHIKKHTPRALAAVSLALFVCHEAYAAGDRRDVPPPQLSQPVCATLYPQANESSVATQHRLQQALDSCPAGNAVRLSPGGLFKSGPLQIPSGVFLRLEAGSTLLADTSPSLYDSAATAGRCGSIDQKGNGCRPFILISNSTGGGVQGSGTIDGQGGMTMAGHNETWWEMARRAQSVPDGKQNAPRLIQIDHSRDVVLYGVRLRNAPNFHVVLNHVQGATVWGIIIDTPAQARNTDGIDPGASQDITITHSFIRTGDDNVAIKAGNGPSQHISITDNHFYSGHGMSIGSEVNAGVNDVVIRNLTLDGTTSGLRIKSDASRGGLVSNIQYSHICMRNNRWPVSFDTHYAPKASGEAIPEYRDIILNEVNASGDPAGTVVLQGYDAEHPLQVYMDGVVFAPDTRWVSGFTYLTTGANGVQPSPPGVDTRHAVSRPQMDCSQQWAAFPM